jgi:hypothetical protein
VNDDRRAFLSYCLYTLAACVGYVAILLLGTAALGHLYKEATTDDLPVVYYKRW